VIIFGVKFLTRKDSPKVAIIGCLHGDELLGAKAIDLLREIPVPLGSITFFIANKDAMRAGKRFIDTDANRCCPGDPAGNKEERIVAQLCSTLAPFDYVIDIHSTTATTEGFVVYTKDNALALARQTPLRHVVRMGPEIAHGRALIDHVKCGVSLEYNQATSPEHVKIHITSCLQNLGIIAGKPASIPQQEYEVYGFVPKTQKPLQNFHETTINGELLYPILAGEKSYPFACMKARKLRTLPAASTSGLPSASSRR
jgi:hypothetical protein